MPIFQCKTFSSKNGIYLWPRIRIFNIAPPSYGHPASIAPGPSRTFTPEAPLWTCVLIKVEFILFFEWRESRRKQVLPSPSTRSRPGTLLFRVMFHSPESRGGEGSKRSRHFFGANTRQCLTPRIRGKGTLSCMNRSYCASK